MSIEQEIVELMLSMKVPLAIVWHLPVDRASNVIKKLR